MASMNITLDMDTLQSTVQARVRPAVEAALAEVDLDALIRKQLAAKAPADAPDHGFGFMMMRMGHSPSTESLLESLVAASIREIAKDFVQRGVRNQKAEIEDALLGMMARHNNNLVKSFAGAITKAFDADWSFDLDVKVTHKTAEADSDD